MSYATVDAAPRLIEDHPLIGSTGSEMLFHRSGAMKCLCQPTFDSGNPTGVAAKVADDAQDAQDEPRG